MNMEFYKKILFTKSPDLIGILDENQHFTNINASFKTVLGYEDEEISAKPYHDFVHPDDRDESRKRSEGIRDLGNEVFNFENRFICKNGDIKWISWSGWKEDFGVIGIGRDITIIKKAIEEKQQAEIANEEKNKFLSRVSHELRTPLNAILGFSQLMQIDDELNLTYLDNILKSGRFLIKLIDDILEISTIGKFDNILLITKWTNLGNVIYSALHTISENKIDITIETIITLFQINVDEDRMIQTILNLLTNAIKYNKPNGKIFISCTEIDNELWINIKDTGIGISKDKLKQLFIPFNRLGMEQTSIQGTGLGLALSKNLLTLMNCKLKVKSELGIGTTFSIILPKILYRRISKTSIEIEENKEDDVFELNEKKIVLYIEDNYLNYYLVHQIFSKYKNIYLHHAKDGKTGIEMVKELNPDLILLDSLLPDLNGIEVLKYIKKNTNNKSKVIALSADAFLMNIQVMLDAGANDYITKPIDIKLLLKKTFACLTSD